MWKAFWRPGKDHHTLKPIIRFRSGQKKNKWYSGSDILKLYQRFFLFIICENKFWGIQFCCLQCTEACYMHYNVNTSLMGKFRVRSIFIRVRNSDPESGSLINPAFPKTVILWTSFCRKRHEFIPITRMSKKLIT